MTMCTCDNGAAVNGGTRRGLLGAAAAAAAAGLLIGTPAAAAAAATSSGGSSSESDRFSLVLLGTNGGPPPIAARFGISTALIVNGKTYVIDCGRGAVSQYFRAGLDFTSLAGIFLTHLHSDHTVDYFSFPLLATTAGLTKPIPVYGPGPAGELSLVADAPGQIPGTAALTTLSNQAFAASTTFFLQEHLGVDPASLVDVHEIAQSIAGPVTVFEDENVRVSAILVVHGAAVPAYAYRFDTEYGSVTFSGDTAPTPNIPTLAAGSDILVHEAVDLAYFEAAGTPATLLDHLEKVHTDVSKLGGIAADADAGRLVVTHLSPGDPSLVSEAAWSKALRASAKASGYRGDVLLGADLMRIPILRK
ncbi:MBL fold metallo-hydrolase [Actinospica sp. MGRD01-02]|uniref:MBL fold metallo-hydrolase n=1 Tax=Actinospica acidithermotolerans TaxID=2828514 RepID=A0A941IMR9_9ACTN|nr:MBL fold metallo-hydrolase [Actinospica acidithermotolerans]MBR7831357.1 MBL fold metallo-hydrolase [Actinospica acidithermotolerans]